MGFAKWIYNNHWYTMKNLEIHPILDGFVLWKYDSMVFVQPTNTTPKGHLAAPCYRDALFFPNSPWNGDSTIRNGIYPGVNQQNVENKLIVSRGKWPTFLKVGFQHPLRDVGKEGKWWCVIMKLYLLTTKSLEFISNCEKNGLYYYHVVWGTLIVAPTGSPLENVDSLLQLHSSPW